MVVGVAEPARRAAAIAENAAVLADIAARGVDISSSCVVDFAHVFREVGSARAFAEEAAREGYAIEIRPFAHEEFSWDVQASKFMAPTAEMITAAEIKLNYLATLHGGRGDGWGFARPR
jgi:hypothetical protein